MKERPILFSAPMVRALLDGTKTVTRRLVKPQPPTKAAVLAKSGSDFSIFDDGRCRDKHGQPLWRVAGPVWAVRDLLGGTAPDGVHWRCPHGATGDRLWVKETHAPFVVGEGLDREVPQCVAYRATCEDDGFDYVNGRGEVMRLKVTKWNPSIFMPRWASRILLEVVSVRVERLHDITEADARAEGIEAVDGEIPDEVHCARAKRIGEMMESGRVVFSLLWDRLSGARSPWESNPWVWRVEFKRIDLDPKTTPGEAAARVVVPSSR